jgi:tetratricopeptide (TPR) repeat protein
VNKNAERDRSEAGTALAEQRARYTALRRLSQARESILQAALDAQIERLIAQLRNATEAHATVATQYLELSGQFEALKCQAENDEAAAAEQRHRLTAVEERAIALAAQLDETAAALKTVSAARDRLSDATEATAAEQKRRASAAEERANALATRLDETATALETALGERDSRIKEYQDAAAEREALFQARTKRLADGLTGDGKIIGGGSRFIRAARLWLFGERHSRADHFAQKGDLARDKNDWPTATALYRKALRLNPALMAIWVQLAMRAGLSRRALR